MWDGTVLANHKTGQKAGHERGFEGLKKSSVRFVGERKTFCNEVSTLFI